MAHQRLIQLVNIHLTILHHVHIAKPRRGSLVREQHIHHKGILPVFIPPGFPQHRVVFAGKQHGFVDKLAVVQQPIPLIIPVYHSGFVAGIHKIVIEIASGYGLAEIEVPREWTGKPLIDLDIRNKYAVNVLVVISKTGEINANPYGATVLTEGSKLIVGGNMDDIGSLSSRLS